MYRGPGLTSVVVAAAGRGHLLEKVLALGGSWLPLLEDNTREKRESVSTPMPSDLHRAPSLVQLTFIHSHNMLIEFLLWARPCSRY